jgi:hypothetical protein
MKGRIEVPEIVTIPERVGWLLPQGALVDL